MHGFEEAATNKKNVIRDRQRKGHCIIILLRARSAIEADKACVIYLITRRPQQCAIFTQIDIVSLLRRRHTITATLLQATV